MFDEGSVKVYRDRTYVSTVMVRHGGTTVAFAMDDQRRVYYSVLDLEQASTKRGPLDARYWNEEPALVPFPGELVEVAAPGAAATAAAGVLRMPVVRTGGRSEADGVTVPADERDPFLSTTARLSAPTPLQVVSDGRHIVLFRQSVEAAHQDAVFYAPGGVVSGDRAAAAAGTKASAAAVVDRSLLCDRFVLVGSVLKPVVEVRYQRSRSKTRGASESDTLGTRDMEGVAFYEPTTKLSFVAPLRSGEFTALQLPTAVTGRSRWQLFALNKDTGRIEGYNCAEDENGLFDVAGSELYTSPDPKYAASVLERGPGLCPYTRRPLIPVPATSDRAGTALRLDAAKQGYVRLPAAPAGGAASAACTVEAWVRPTAASGTILSQAASPSTTFALELDADRKPVVDIAGTRVVSGVQLPLSAYTHVAAVFDGRTAVLYVDGVKAGSAAVTAVPDARSAAVVGARLVSGAPQSCFTGDIDEVRVWERARQEAEFGDRGRRLSGVEAGLSAYYRFDEGTGTTLGDHTRARRDATALGGVAWVESSAPVGDGPGLARDVFAFADRAVKTGLTATMYFQQEPATSGYGGTASQEKRQSRLLLACGTTGPAPAGGDPGRSYVAAVDFGLTREGRLAAVPAVVTLAGCDRPKAVGADAAIAAATARVDAARAALDADRLIASKIPQYLTDIDAYNAARARGEVWTYFRDMSWTAQALKDAQPAQQRLGARQAALAAAEDTLATLSGGTAGGGDTVVEMPLVSTDRQGLTVFGGLLAFAWTEETPSLLDSSTGDLVLYFRGGSGQFFSVYYATLVSRATRSAKVGNGTVQFVARDTATRLKDFTVVVAPDSVADRCVVTVTCGPRTETFRSVPRAAASLAAVLNGNLPPGTPLGSVRSVSGRTVELAVPLAEALAAGSRVSVDGRVRQVDAAVPAGAKSFTVTGGAVASAVGAAVSRMLYDYADATCSVAGVDLSRGSQIVSVSRFDAAEAVPDGTAADQGDGVGPHWRGHAPGRAPAFDGSSQYLLASDTADFAVDRGLTLEAWVNPTATGADHSQQVDHGVLHAAAPAVPYGLSLRSSRMFQGIELLSSNTVDFGDRLSLGGRDFTIEMWLLGSTSPGMAQRLFTSGDLGLELTPDGTLGITVRGYTVVSVPSTDNRLTGSWQHWTLGYTSATGKFQMHCDGNPVQLYDGRWDGSGLPMRYDSDPGKPTRLSGIAMAAVSFDDIRVWDTVRSAEQIKAGMWRRLRGHESGLLAYWQFDDGLLTDRSGNGHDGTLTGTYQSKISPLVGHRAVARVGAQTFTTKDPNPYGDWTHVAFAFKQQWAMATDGGHLDAGGPDGLDLTADLTIEAGVRIDRLGTVHGLIGKGVLGGGRADSAVPYALYVRADGEVAFAFEPADGRQGVREYRSGLTLKPGTFARVAVTRKHPADAKGAVAIQFHVGDATSMTVSSTFTFDGPVPVGNDGSCELGLVRNGRAMNRLRGCLTDVRIWKIAREGKQIGAPIAADTPGLVAWWNFPEKEGPVTADACNTYPAKLGGARRVRTPDPKGNQATFYVNGVPETAEVAPTPAQPGDPTRTAVGGRWTGGALTEAFAGTLDEVRVWRTCRTREQILDNMFGRLHGELNDLVAYYPFDGASTTPGANAKDHGPRRNDLTPSPTPPRNVVSSAPISADTAEVRSALTGIATTFNTLIGTTPTASEYGDLQSDANGHPFGVMKRAYGYVRNNRWYLRTGYKIGELATTWVGQAQFQPQLIGFLEGAPPMPSENLVWGTADDYAEKSSVSFVRADSVSDSLSHDEKRSFNASAEAKIGGSLTFESQIITAPLGIGTSSPVMKFTGDLYVSGKIEHSNSWANNVQVTQSTGTTRTSKVALTGNWEEDAASGQVNPAAGRRWVPANAGFAVVQSATADVYALRLAHSGVLVAYRMVPNADIPRDWNIIAFPINPKYTKQGTLDGVVGYAPKGTSGALQPFADPAFPTAGDGGEYSYYRPREAYALKRRIRREEQQLQTFYESVSTLGYTAAFGSNPVRDQATRVVGGMLGHSGAAGLGAADSDPATARKAAKDAARRHLVNTYVWTAAGGLFTETTSTTDQVTEVTAGDFSLSGSLTVGGGFKFDGGSVGVEISGSVTVGGGYAVTRSKTKEASRTFSLEVSAEPGRNLQKSENGKPVFGADRSPVLVPGRVDAYRFMTFYLDSSADNYEDFYGKVIDPEWLERDTGAAARALRETRQDVSKPPCWRVLHRVTYVSRVLDTATTTPSLAQALGSLGITSDYQLMRQLEPHLIRATGSTAALTTATKDVIATRFPTLVPYTDTITARVTAYYNLDAGTPALPAPAGPATPATTPTLTTTTPTVAAGADLTFSYSTPAATLAAKNWIGLYRAGTGPGNGDAVAWKYAPDAAGTVTIPATGPFTAGTYTAWYLHNDGYTPLANPATITVT
ncbi:LamG-like jellyroll fold domain-containing protein [Kitasatospora sp. NPDC101235]|uniref:LamG domain-containing protein n=1 Tax=Kitasatospora sp. NPDC101235 TaxID=3364101 RepID=UPI00382F148E